MKKINILLCAVATMAAASCAEKEIQANLNEPVEMTFSAASKNMTRTSLTEGNKVVWCADDQISVFDGVSNNAFSIYDYTEASGTAKFGGTALANAEYYAAYPYSADNTYAGGTFCLTLPAAQTATDGTFADSYALAVAKAVDGYFAFQNATSLVKVVLADDIQNIASISLKGNNDEQIAGKVSVTLGADGVVSAVAAEGAKEVTLTGALAAGKTYYFTIAGDVAFTKGLTFTVTMANDETVVISDQTAITIEKGKILPLFTSLSADRWAPTLEYGEENTFGYAATQAFTGSNIVSATVVSTPEGWTTDLTDGIKITAPSQEAVTAEGSKVAGKGNVVLALTSKDGSSKEVSVPVRLYGINDDSELVSFLDAYGRANGAARGDISKYVVDGTIVLNNNINAPQGQFTSSAFLAYNLDTPLNGNNKTITATCSGPNGVVCLFQNLKADVKNLKIAGTMTCTQAYTKQARMGSLAASLNKSGVVVENVHSSATITYSPTGIIDRNSTTDVKTYVGGLVGNSAAKMGITYKNCSYSGTITVNYRARAIGGIMAASEEGNYVKADGSVTRDQCVETKLSGCKFTGELNYNVTVKQKTGGVNDRVGGLIGDATRVCVIENQCVSAGKININASCGTAGEFIQSVGGIVGWKSNVAQLDINNSSTSTLITVTNLNGSAQAPSGLTTYFDPVAGNTPNTEKGYIKCSNVTCTGKVVYSYYNNGAEAGEITTSKHQLN